MRHLTIESDTGLQARIVPSRGAAIVSLRTGAGLEVLAQGITGAPPSRRYVDGGLGGYDDCFPGIEAEHDVTDHGDLWYRSWEVVSRSRSSIRTRCEVGPVRFERATSLVGDELRIGIRVRAAAATSFLWAGHLLLAVDDDTVVALPSRALPESDDREPEDAEDGRREVSGSRWRDVPAGWSSKTFSRNTGRQPWLERSGYRVSIRSDQPWWGVWVNNRAFPPGADYEHVGFEATTAPHDALSAAIRDSSVTRIDARSGFRAGVAVTIRDVSRTPLPRL